MRLYIDTGLDVFDMSIEPDDEGKKMFIKIATSDGGVFSGELSKQEKEFLSPPDKI